MTATEKDYSLSSMSARDMFSLWWKEKWVRGLVLALSPIGLIDAIFTILLFQAHGADYEYNPIVRLALTSDWWYVWIIVDIVSFVIFAMVAGSYYIHTRSSIFGNHTGWLSALVGLRAGAAAYNITLFYGDYYPIFWGGLSAVLSFFAVNKLLSRDRDISIRGFKMYWRAKYDRIHDRIITRGTGKSRPEEKPQKPVKEDMSTSLGLWMKRAGYISIAVIVFVSIPFILTAVGYITGGIFWSDIYGSGFFWNTLSARSFMAGFVVILILMSIIMYFILKAFGSDRGGW